MADGQHRERALDSLPPPYPQSIVLLRGRLGSNGQSTLTRSLAYAHG
jgi:hypothetical protein